MNRRDELPTGIEPLDRELDGGITPGSLVAYTAPPESQSELLLYELTAQRNTLYISTARTEPDIRNTLDEYIGDFDQLQIEHTGGETPMENAAQLIQQVTDSANIIIDTVDIFEQTNRRRYINFINDVKNTLTNTDSLGIFYGLDGHQIHPLRDVTLSMADLVWQLTIEMRAEELETRLAIPKVRTGTPVTEPLKLQLQDTVAVDTSREIS